MDPNVSHPAEPLFLGEATWATPSSTRYATKKVAGDSDGHNTEDELII